MDEMWSYVGSKKNQRWLWHAIDHATGKILAYVFGERKDIVFLMHDIVIGVFINRYECGFLV